MYFKGIRLLNAMAKRNGIRPKQSLRFTAKRFMIRYGHYRIAGQTKRAKAVLKKLKTAFGRLIRDFSRKVSAPEINDKNAHRLLDCCVRIFNQQRSDKNKIYSYHAQEVRCIAKGKAHKKYEFGNKVSISSTAKSGWIVGIKSFDENIYDGKTAKDSIEQVTRISGSRPSEALVGRGYRGYQGDINGTTVYHQGQKRGISKTMRAWLRRRSRIEPLISHLKSDHRIGRNFLSGTLGDEINSTMAGVAFNLRKILKALANYWRVFFLFVLLSENFLLSQNSSYSSG